MTPRHLVRNAAAGAGLACLATLAVGQSQSWDIPRASVRAVLQQWAQERGYGIVWSEGIPDFPTREARIDGEFASAAARLVDGSAYDARNLYCPPALTFPATAYTPAVRVEASSRLLFVYGVPAGQECRPI